MNRVRIRIAGHPVAKGRGRAVRRGNHVAVITPEKTRRWEDDARIMARQAMDGNHPMVGPLIVMVVAEFYPPESWPERKRAAAISGDIAHTGKPDCDNLGKAACDALNGIAWIDDAQIVRLEIHKRYSKSPGVEIFAERFQAHPASITARKQLEVVSW